MARFIPPDAAEADWMIRSETALPYLRFMTNIHELLCLYSPSHGLPHGIELGETRGNYESRLIAQIKDFELTRSTQSSEIAGRLKQDVKENKDQALMLYNKQAHSMATDPEVDEFLNTLLDTYTFLTIAGRRRRP